MTVYSAESAVILPDVYSNYNFSNVWRDQQHGFTPHVIRGTVHATSKLGAEGLEKIFL